MTVGRTSMPGFRRVMLSLALSFALFGVVSLTSCRQSPRPAAHPTEVAEIPGHGFTVRISEFPEEHPVYLEGAYYRFESLPSGSKDWVMAIQVRTDDDIPLPKQNVRFLAPQSAFVFMGWEYAVTTDGGRHWSVWNAQKDLPGWKYDFIKEIELEKNGRGKMVLNTNPSRPGEAELVTSDFGVHWAPPQLRD